MNDPFDPASVDSTMADLVKNLERRWGLTIVSLLPESAHAECIAVQHEIARLCGLEGTLGFRAGREYVEFQEANQLHCTHLTLRRSDPQGPVAVTTLLKEGHELSELVDAVRDVTSRVSPIEVRLRELRVRSDGLGIVAVGECADEASATARRTLLSDLLGRLRQLCNLSPRSWDEDVSRYHLVHCALGFLKRGLPAGFAEFRHRLENQDLEISCEFSDISIVHHRHRTLLSPHHGCVTFPMGEPTQTGADELARALNLEDPQ